MRNVTNFLITLLEWYEFSVYNALIPYGIFGGTGHAVRYGFALGALTFLARPVGSVYFSGITNKSKALKQTLIFMATSTILMGLYPGFIPKPIWFGVCKLLQGFALGGSYGVAYLSVYEKEQGKKVPRTNYKLGLVQTGWVYGMLLGQFTVLVFKLLFGNLGLVATLLKSNNYTGITQLTASPAFISFGWRFIFLVSGICGLVLYFRTKEEATPAVAGSPGKESGKKNILSKVGASILKKPFKFIQIFLVLSLDMIISHGWFTFHEVSTEASQKVLTPNIVANIRRVLLLVGMPIMGYITDLLNQYFRGKGNTIILGLTYILVMWLATVELGAMKVIPWILLSSLTTSMCFGALMGWAIKEFGKDAGNLFGTTCALTSALVGGTLPLMASFAERPGALIGYLAGISFLAFCWAHMGRRHST